MGLPYTTIQERHSLLICNTAEQCFESEDYKSSFEDGIRQELAW